LGRGKRTTKPRSFVLSFFFVFFFVFFCLAISFCFSSHSASRHWKKSAIHLQKQKIVLFLEATRENKRKKLASPRAVIAQESAHHSGRTRSSWTHRSLHRLQVLPISRFFFSLHIFLWFFPSLAKRFF
jgi:hypothetical protein